MQHNLFSDTVIFSRNFHLRLAIADSEDKQLIIFLGMHLQYLGILSNHISYMEWLVKFSVYLG